MAKCSELLDDNDEKNHSFSPIIDESSFRVKAPNGLSNFEIKRVAQRRAWIDFLSCSVNSQSTDPFYQETIAFLEYNFASLSTDNVYDNLLLNENVDPEKGDSTNGNGQTIDALPQETYRPVIIDGPELVYPKKLPISTFIESPHIFSDICTCMMSTAKKEEPMNADKPWTASSTIEIFPVSENRSKWKIILRRVDIEYCEKYCKENVENRTKLIDYFKRARKEERKNRFKQKDDGSEQPSCPGTATNKCSELYTCDCKFFVCKQHCIKETNTYKADVRCKGRRVITISPSKHCNNEQWVQTTEAWKAVSEVIGYLKKVLGLKNLPIEWIYISFGHWQSQVQSNRLKPEDCHAHINLVLTQEAVKASKGKLYSLWKKLRYSIIAPKNYRLWDAILLDKHIKKEDPTKAN